MDIEKSHRALVMEQNTGVTTKVTKVPEPAKKTRRPQAADKFVILTLPLLEYDEENPLDG